MEKEGEITESGIRAFQCLMQRLKDATDQFLNGTHLIPAENTGIPSILSEVQDLIKNSSEKTNKEYADYVGLSGAILDMWFKVESWQFNCVFSSDNKSDFFYLLIMCSLNLNWTDKSHDFRSSLIDSGCLFYHVMQLKALETIRFSEVAKELATYHVAIITNCAQESSFCCYISTIKWKALLSPWVDCSSKNIQFHTRLLCCFVASSMDPDELQILDMNSADLQTILNMLGTASTSIELKASGFGFTFSATEILQSLLHLFISRKNLLSLSSLDVMPTILALLLNGQVQDKMLTCQLLWILLGECHFQWDEELYCNAIKELLIVMAEDESLQVVSKLLLNEPCMGLNDFQDELQVVDNFLQMSPDQWCHTSGLSKYCYFIRSLATSSVNKRVLFIILLQKLDSMETLLNLLSANPIVASQNDYQCTEHSSDTKYPQNMWMRKMLCSCEVIMHRFLKASADDKTTLFPFVCEFWRILSNFGTICIPSVLKAAVDGCAGVWSFWHVLYELLSLLFEAEMSGLGTKKIQICLIRIITILRDWSAISKCLCSSLLKKGLILNHSYQLLKWTRKNYSKMVEYMVKANLRILLNCLHCSEFKVYVKAFDWLTLLAQLHNTTIPAIQLAAKTLGCHVNCSVELFEDDINQMLDVIAKAAGSSYELNELAFYSLDMVMCLHEFIDQSRSDILPIIQASILPVLVTLFSNGTSEEKVAISLFIWNLLSLKKYDLGVELAYSDLLQVFEVCGDDEELNNINKCILASCAENICADSPTEEQPNNLDALIKTAYKHSRYTECVSWCLKKESSSPFNSDDLETKVIRAKALYHLYKSERGKIQFDISTKEEYYKASQKCYNRTKEVIGLLGMAYDKNSLDIEGCKMLVLSMMDYIHTTDKLNDCKRCYLCWKKLHAATVTNPGSNSEIKKHSKLVHSHPIPYSLLDRFAHSVPSKRNLKMFHLSAESTQMEPHKGKVYAPKQMTRDMFCTTCEDILSAKGETQFMRDFFDKIYDYSDPTKSCQSQEIEYGKWLYHFCAGLIYRNLIWEENSFLNEDELYKLLLGCREYILSSKISSNSPDIYVLITPIGGDEKDLNYGSINNILAGSLEWYIGRHKLDNNFLEVEDAVLASFFLFHLGAINILVKFNPSQGYVIDNCFKVKADNSQIFFVPEEMKRKEALPPGMWAHLLNEARFAEQESLEKSASPSIDSGPMCSEGFELFGILHGVKKQLSETTAKGVQPSPSGSEKKFNFLPAGFELRSEARPNSISLPCDHLILVHHTFAYGTGKGETIFIVTDAIKDACYLIWNNFIPGLQYSVAFHYSPSEMLLMDVVTDKQSSSALQSPHFQHTLNDAKKKISSVLPEVLLKKGIFSLESLLLRVKGITNGSFPSVDMKCSKETNCWYCSNRCDVCLKILGFNSMKMSVNKMDVNVCNQDCAWYLPGKKIQTSIIVGEPGESPPPFYEDRSCPLFTSHKKYFHVYIQDTADCLPTKSDIAVCFGDGSAQYSEEKMYMVFFSRNIQKQMLFECFLSDSFNLLCPLPYNESNFLLTSVIKTYEDEECIRQYLCLAYDELKKPIGSDYDTKESPPPSPDTLYGMACAIADDMLNPTSISDKKAKDEISSKLRHWSKYFVGLQLKDRDILILHIVTTPDIVKTYLTFADSLFSESGSKHQCLWTLNQIFALWSSTTSLMPQLLTENGLMTGILIELQAFSNCPSSEDIIYLIQLALSILCNLLQVSSNVAYFLNTVCDQIVRGFTTSMDPKIRILSTSILSYLEPKLKLDYHLELKNEDVKLMLSLVLNTISKYSIIIHPVPMLRSLHVIMKISASNAKQFVSHRLLAIISEIIETSDKIMQRELVLILWTLASYPTFVEMIKSEVNLLGIVSSLKDRGDPILSTASMCALWETNEESRDGAGFIAFAHGCYQFGMYERCVTTCTKILQLSSSDSDIQEIRLLKGKSLFHLCNEGIEKLPKTISPKDIKLKQVWSECIKYATEAVNLLGSAHDHSNIDEDGSKYLDLCMMFLISSGNSLNKCQRCLLCLSNLKSVKGKGEQDSTAKKHKGLQHSHVIPKAVLEAFSSGIVKTTSQRIFRLCGTETSLSQLKSPKECTWFILCSKCEQLFGIFEEQFVNNFFKRIYNVSNPATPLEAQEIDYGHWLYQFCVSLFFRGIAILDIPCNDNVKRFQNSEKLYEIFARCRQILLAPSHTQIIPSIHILINNTSPTPEDRQLYTTMHEVLVSPEILGVAAEKDPKKYFVGPSKASLFLAHMGIINVVVDVEATMLSNRHLISQEGGLYRVPPDSERDQFIPPDVKEIFYTSAKQMEIQKELIPDKLRKSHWAKGVIGHPPEDHEQTFLVHPAQKKDSEVFLEEGVRPSQDPSKVKVVCFLPLEFKLSQTTGLLEVPPGHHILYHCEPEGCRGSFDKGITVFLAIGNDSKGYTPDKPYAIYHKYDPGLQFNMAMFVSSADLSVTTLINGGSRQQTAEMLFNDSHFKENIRLTLNTALHQMGFATFNSFLPHAQDKRVHSKCLTKRRCWYCINRCDNCMVAAAVGLTMNVNGVTVKFCSKVCDQEFNTNPRVLNLLPAAFCLTNNNGKLTALPPAGHKMLQRVNDYFDEDEHELAATHTIRICVGDGSVDFPKDKLYIIYKATTVLSQTLVAFFISDEFSVIPLTASPKVCDAEVVLWFSKRIQPHVCSVLDAVVSQAGFASFQEWGTAAIQGKESYFATIPFYEQY